MNHKNLKVVFIGAGHHATWTLYPTFQFFPDVRIVANCDLDLAKAKEQAGRFGIANSYTDYCEMIEREKPDVVFCCGGPALHEKVIEECIQRKLPLFTEKPPATSAAKVKELAAKADAAGVPIMVGFMHRFALTTRWARMAMTGAGFGNVTMVYGREGIWATSAKTLVMDSGIHHIDLLQSLAGPVKALTALKVARAADRNAYAVNLEFESGALGSLNLNSLESLSTPSDVVEIHGDGGQWVRIDNWQRATLYKDPQFFQGPPLDLSNSSLVYEHPWTGSNINTNTRLKGYFGEMEHFFQSLEKQEKPRPDLWDGYRAMRVVEMINQSADAGGTKVAF